MSTKQEVLTAIYILNFCFIFFEFCILSFLAFFCCRPYLSSLLRETLADYALPLSVIVFSLIGSFAFASVQRKSLSISGPSSKQTHTHTQHPIQKIDCAFTFAFFTFSLLLLLHQCFLPTLLFAFTSLLSVFIWPGAYFSLFYYFV